MDIYGKLNNEVVKKEYVGSTTDTAKVKVDNQSNVISAEVNKVPHKLYIDFEDDQIPNKVYDGSEDTTLVIPELGAVTNLQVRMRQAEVDISGLKEKDIELTNKDTQIENNAKNIKVEDNHNGSFDFTNYQGQTVTIQSGYPADDDTIKVIDNKLTAQAIKDETSTITPAVVRNIDSKIHLASKEAMGMVYAWKANDGTIFITLDNPGVVDYNTEELPNGSLIYNFDTYNYSTQIQANGSIEYNIGE